MFDLGWTELLVIAVVAILVVGPKDLPQMLRTIGQFAAKMRSMAREFQRQFEEAARDTGLDDVRKGITSVKDVASPSKHVKDAFNSIAEETRSIKDAVEAPAAATGTKSSGAGAAAAKPAGPDPSKQAAKAASPATRAASATAAPATPAKKSAKPATKRAPAAKPAAKRKAKPAATTES
jgi:sec-independent protein translocase protein TatB